MQAGYDHSYYFMSTFIRALAIEGIRDGGDLEMDIYWFV